MKFDIITIFPKIFDSYFNESILKRAQKKKLIKIKAHDFRVFASDKHKTAAPRRSFMRRQVDDKAYGGGPGMVLKVEPIFKCVKYILSKIKNKKKTRIILFSTRGAIFDNNTAKRLAKYENLILICGHYEGVDERVAQYIADEEISMGDYVLTGGELPAMIVVDAVSRYISGVLGKTESLEDIKGSYSVYTRPAVFEPRKIWQKCPPKFCKSKKWSVPDVLLSGDHKAIEEWRKEN